MKSKLFASAVALALVVPVSLPVAAQESVVAETVKAEPVAAMAVVPAAKARTLPAGTIVSVAPLTEITSKRVEVGETYQFQVVNDVVENGETVIPRGATATGVIKWKTGRAIGGKSGKFEIEFSSVAVNGRTIALTGIHRQEGRGNTVGALLGSMFISGRSAVMLPGQMVNALTKEPTPY